MSLNIQGLTFAYGKKTGRIFDDFSIEVKEGSVLAVLGKSGSGKSTLLRIIAGLETGASGDIYIKERLCQGKGVFIPPEKRNVGLVVQDYALFPFMTVEQNIRFGMKGKDDDKYNFLVGLTHLNGLEKRYPHEISGGQQQRAALCRTLGSEPSLLLLDEPFSSLDIELVSEVRVSLKEILDKNRLTTVFVTHNMEDARFLADDIIEL